MPVRQEIIEFVNAVTADIGDDPIDWAVNAANEAVDVLAAIVANLDDVHKATDLAALRVEVITAATEVAARLEIPWGLGMAVPTIAGALVDQLGQFSGSVEEFKSTRLMPALVAVEQFGHRGIVLLTQE